MFDLLIWLLCEVVIAVCGFLFVYVILAFEFRTNNFRYEDLSLTAVKQNFCKDIIYSCLRSSLPEATLCCK
jgi:hypothetical protein